MVDHQLRIIFSGDLLLSLLSIFLLINVTTQETADDQVFNGCIQGLTGSLAPYTVLTNLAITTIKLTGCLNTNRPDVKALFDNSAKILENIEDPEDTRYELLMLPYYDTQPEQELPQAVTDDEITAYCLEEGLGDVTDLSVYQEIFQQAFVTASVQTKELRVTKVMIQCLYAAELDQKKVGTAIEEFYTRRDTHNEKYIYFLIFFIEFLGCPGTYDCLGQCGGDHEEDCLGVCDGSAVVDCNGICDGWAVVDCNGVCGGGAQFDCNGVCGGPDREDCAGVCGGPAVEDCAGTCRGVALRDCAGTCDGNLVVDCNGDCGGTAMLFLGCAGHQICYGGNAALREVDKVCIENNACSLDYRADDCGVCASNPGDDSPLKDCTGTCFTQETLGNRKTEDACGVCDGDKEICDPHVTSINIQLIPANDRRNFTAQGDGFLTPELGIVLEEYNEAPIGIKRKRSVTSHVVEITNIRDAGNIEGVITGLTGGVLYRVGAGPSLSTYHTHNFGDAKVYCYDENAITVTAISPQEYTMTTRDAIVFTMTGTGFELDLPDDIEITRQMIYKGIFPEDARQNAVIRSATEVQSPVAAPQDSARGTVCFTLDGVDEVNACQTITIYQKPPEVTSFVFNSKGSGMTMTFDLVVDTTNLLTCEMIFEDVSLFGREPDCCWNLEKNALSITLGFGARITTDSSVVLKEGLMADTTYPRAGGPITLSATFPVQRSHPEIQPVNWPTQVTLCVTALSLEIAIINGMAGRKPASIMWTVDDGEPVSGGAIHTVELLEVKTYTIKVVVTNFMGRSTTVTRSIERVYKNIPSAILTVKDAKTDMEGRFLITPKRRYFIEVKYEAGSCRTETTKIWKKDGILVTGSDRGLDLDPGIFHLGSCGVTFLYTLETSLTASPSVRNTASASLYVVCHNPVAVINPGDAEIVIGVGDGSTTLNSLSYDPEGAELTYSWDCIFDGDGLDCKTALQLTDKTALQELVINNNLLVKNAVYVIKLTVTSVKGHRWTSDTVEVRIRVKEGNYPQVKIQSGRREFRADVPIYLTAEIINADTVIWNIPRTDECVFKSALAGSTTKLVNGRSSFTVAANVLAEGSVCVLEVRAYRRTQPDYVSTRSMTIYIYNKLRNCEIVAKELTEGQETRLDIEACVYDDSLTMLDIKATCLVEGLRVAVGSSFMVPPFKDQGTTATTLACVVKDSLGHEMEVNSGPTEVQVGDSERISAQVQSVITQRRIDGDLVVALEMTAAKIYSEDQSSSAGDHALALEILQEMKERPSTVDEKRRMLNAIGKLMPEKTDKPQSQGLAESEVNLLKALCESNDLDPSFKPTKEEVKTFVERAKEFVENGAERSLYRKVENYLACVVLKTFQHGESLSVDAENFKQRIMLGNLADTGDTGVTFPESLKEKCQQMECSGPLCKGCGYKYEAYTGDPPDIKTGRQDTSCTVYVVLDLYDASEGTEIPVNSLVEPIEFEVPGDCPDHKCVFHNTRNGQFESSGLSAFVSANNKKMCRTDHLTAFTVYSDPPQERRLNIALLTCAIVGALTFTATVIIIILAIKRSGSSKIGSHLHLFSKKA